jgi:type VI protein secretion system component VasF
MERSEALERRRGGGLQRRRRKSGGLSVWSVVGGAALLAVAYVFVKNLPDIRRYIKIEMM